MKKIIKNSILITFMAIICIGIGIAMTASAYEWYVYDDFEYWVDGDEVGIINYLGDETELIIPAEINGLKVDTVSGIQLNHNIKKIIISEGIKKIGYESFDACRNLEEIYFPKSLELYQQDDGQFLPSLKRFVVHEENPYYSTDENGVLFNKDKTHLISYPQGSELKTYTVPETVEHIGFFSMVMVLNLEELILPENLKSFGECAIGAAFDLKKITVQSCESIRDMFGSSISLKEAVLEDVDLVSGSLFDECYSLDKIYIKDMDTVFADDVSFGRVTATFPDGEPGENFMKYYKLAMIASWSNDEEELNKYYPLFEQEMENMIYFDDPVTLATIYCHSDSTAENFAAENGYKYELTHFFEGDWIYDYDNMIRFRKCIFCDELETEALETNESGDVDIIAPVDPDTDFEVENIEKGSDHYVLVQDALSETEYTLLKAFDITLKNKDGVHVQPDGTVKVKLPLDWEKDGNYKVYRVNDDGTLTDMNAYRQGSHMVFDTDHFSIYIIVDETPAEPDIPTESKSDFFSKIFSLLTDFFNLITSFIKSIF